MNEKNMEELEVKNTEDIFEPVLGEIVSEDSFAFTLLSCHCNSTTVGF